MIVTLGTEASQLAHLKEYHICHTECSVNSTNLLEEKKVFQVTFNKINNKRKKKKKKRKKKKKIIEERYKIETNLVLRFLIQYSLFHCHSI